MFAYGSPSLNLGIYLTRSARHWPEHPALVCGDRTWTYARLEERANRLASALVRRGLGPDDAVASSPGTAASWWRWNSRCTRPG